MRLPRLKFISRLFRKPSESAPRRLCALHIDDSPWIRMPVSVVLRRHFGMRVIEASNGPDGMTLARQERPDLIILDVMMPREDGFDTLARLKDDPFTKDIPVLMCTARDHTREVNMAAKLGAHGYLTKPIEEDLLVGKVREILVSMGKWSDRRPAPRPEDSTLAPPSHETVIPAGEARQEAPPAGRRPAPRACPSCHNALTFIPQYDAWYCYGCRKYPDFPEHP